MKLHLPELLCPAGDEAALKAAVDSGANAVYLGYKSFGARASAVNFDDEALARAIDYAHLHHVRVHVTVNTLVKPGEIDGIHQALSAIQAAGADAIIVQDAGVAEIARRDYPGLHLHASTQMAICNASGVQAAHSLGFDRVVLARECGLEEIRRACQTGVEIEVFAHGALCTAVSGRCLMSSMSGGRSGNRGRCAQPCRQRFSMDGQEGPLLSLRDLCTLDDLPQLCSAGIASLKIEGRLKNAEYVAVVAGVYRRALDAIAAGTFKSGDKAEKERLLQIFNRGGFTRGHAGGAEDAALVTPERVSHEGIPIGEILSVRRELATLRVDRDLNDGDSLQLRGQTDGDMRYSGHNVPAGGTATLRLRPGLQAKAGMSVSRLNDAKQLEAARAHTPKPIPVSMEASFALGKPMVLQMCDGHTSISVSGPDVQAAQNRASTPEDVCRQLEKLGGTPFVLNQPVRVQMEHSLFLPVSALNALRREAVEKLTEERIHAFAVPAVQKQTPSEISRPKASVDANTVAVLFSDPSQARNLLDAGATMLIWNPAVWSEEALRNGLSALPEGAWLRLPPQLSQPSLEMAQAVISSYAYRLGGVVAESIGQLGMDYELPILAGEGVPVTNREGMLAISRFGVSGFLLWPEWSAAEQKGLLPLTLPALLKVYGRERLMLLNHCPERVRLGLSERRADCRLCKSADMVCGKKQAAMTDRKGYRFPLQRIRFPEGCEISALGALPTDLRAHNADRLHLGAGALLDFTVETPEEQIALTRLYAAWMRGEKIPAPGFETTAGHWLRGVE